MAAVVVVECCEGVEEFLLRGERDEEGCEGVEEGGHADLLVSAWREELGCCCGGGVLACIVLKWLVYDHKRSLEFAVGVVRMA